MAKDAYRRTLKLAGDRKADLTLIKQRTGATTDTAAVNDAIQFRAKYANCDPRELDLGLWLLGQIDSVQDGPTRTVILENPAGGSVRLAVPSLR
jgi:hypothetical protein